MKENMRKSVRNRSLVFVCLSNNEAILEGNLLRSPVFSRSAARLHVERDAPSATIGYNRALAATDEDLVVFLHHDVFLPAGWEDLLWQRVEQVEQVDPEWALIGPFGIGQDGMGYGPVWSTSLGQIVGRVPGQPMEVQSFDEMLFVLRRDCGLSFDEQLKGFHFYGTDIVQQAAARGLAAYATPLPCIHNDKFKAELDSDFRQAYHYLRRKWRTRLPVQSPIIKISWHGLNLMKRDLHNTRDRQVRLGMSQSVDIDPITYAARCSWNDIAPKPD